MPKRRPKKAFEPLREINRPANVLQTNKAHNNKVAQSGYSTAQAKNIDQSSPPSGIEPALIGEITGLKSLIEVENCQPSTSSAVDNLNTNTAALYSELDTFRQRWKRELEETKQPEPSKTNQDSHRGSSDTVGKLSALSESQRIDDQNPSSGCKETGSANEEIKIDSTSDLTYAKAKKLFLIAVDLERDEMHHESIGYYKQAMHLCPDIEKQIFREQCEASAKAAAALPEQKQDHQGDVGDLNDVKSSEEHKIQLYDRIFQNYQTDDRNRNYAHCRPGYKPKSGTLHISNLPRELILQIYHFVVGEELDLASLESVGMVCRSFYLLSKEPSLWKNICCVTWGKNAVLETVGQSFSAKNQKLHLVCPIDWRQMFLNRPRINFDGVYISRTRYIRQGDIGFQDLSYRPFHVVRYYRYLRFFPDRRVLILTTNEEPDKIIPIFRHALNSKQFSPELSILEGKYEFSNVNLISIEAEKDCRASIVSTQNQRRQAQFHWSRQTPISQKFNLKFELRTVENKPYKNNVLKWLEYTILSRLETGQEMTAFDMTAETFPNLIFSRVKKFNLRMLNPLSSQ